MKEAFFSSSSAYVKIKKFTFTNLSEALGGRKISRGIYVKSDGKPKLFTLDSLDGKYAN
jgi:hypothetical protein